MVKNLAIALIFGGLTVTAGMTMAQTTTTAEPGKMDQGQIQHAGMDHGTTAAPEVAPSTRAFMAGMEKMHADMAVDYTGNADVDFATAMIPHHQGAIDMARVQLEFGKDPELRALAEAIIKAQETEIAEMQGWLDAHSN